MVVILGQTASGKSSLAVKLARKFGGEVISADSRQVYKYMNIGTGKITEAEMRGVPHHLLDVVHPKKTFTVAEFKKLADDKIADIISRGKLPIIAGGTGFYIDAVVDNIVLPEVPPNTELRDKLEKLPADKLLAKLEKLDPDRAYDIRNKNEVNNTPRLIRAIEIATALGKVPKIKKQDSPYEFIKIGLDVPAENLHKKITKRVGQMFADGLLEEIKILKKKGVTLKRLQEFGFEYNNPTPDSVVAESIKYAKRQMTWFKRDPQTHWLPAAAVSGFLQKTLSSANKK